MAGHIPAPFDLSRANHYHTWMNKVRKFGDNDQFIRQDSLAHRFPRPNPFQMLNVIVAPAD